MDKIMIQKLFGIARGGLLVGGILFLLLSLAEQWHNIQTFLAAFSCIGLSCLFHLPKRQFYETDKKE